MKDLAHLSARVPSDVRNTFKSLAAKRGQAVQDLLLQLVEEFIENQAENKPRLSDVLPILRARKADMMSLGVTHLQLVGSTARNEAKPGSDIDLVMEFDMGRKPDLFKLADIQQRIEGWFDNRFPVDIGLKRTLKAGVAANMAADAIEIF